MRRSVFTFTAVALILGSLLFSASGCRRAKPEATSTPLPARLATEEQPAPSPTGTVTPLSVTDEAASPSPSLTPTQDAPTAVPTHTQTPVVPTATPVPTEPDSVSPSTPVPTASPPSSAEAMPTEFSYTVLRGDSLWSLAQRFGTTVEDIAERNGLPDYNSLSVGQVLKIWGVVPDTPAPGTAYVVQEGDNLSSIARELGTTVEEMQRVNGIANPSLIFPGQVLKVPGDGASPPDAPATTARQYVVRPGDNLGSIADAHNTTVMSIRIANDISNPNRIYAGQVLIIP